MTHGQELMLAVCFGATIGTFISNLITIGFEVVTLIKEKSRKDK